MPAWRVLNVLSSIKAAVEVVEETHMEDYTYWEMEKPVALPWATLPEKKRCGGNFLKILGVTE